MGIVHQPDGGIRDDAIDRAKVPIERHSEYAKASDANANLGCACGSHEMEVDMVAIDRQSLGSPMS